ncbi:HK97 gp10 family phage protein [Enterococcus sp. BWR-S5]|uniref:HK97 gp10 family phage protein n=1 Tax=Enterococcus sp. BWR-S5 TaxID=2787714 RepID=UPI001921A320|nr:HK97 gp10 family phage protein [Enterococcus sp. BWR-S5]MBL1226604.1 HK97 gp10 family phage protein [Enterococcus sp. BWR-S5]
MTTTDNLTAAIVNELRTYTEEVQKDIDAAAEKITKEAADRLKADSPKRTKKYSKGWRVKKVSNGGENSFSWIVHNATRYQLTHLLERDHALRNGGRSTATKHIEPVEAEAVQEFIQAVEGAIRR